MTYYWRENKAEYFCFLWQEKGKRKEKGSRIKKIEAKIKRNSENTFVYVCTSLSQCFVCACLSELIVYYKCSGNSSADHQIILELAPTVQYTDGQIFKVSQPKWHPFLPHICSR